jgi:chromosome segregation ATPase
MAKMDKEQRDKEIRAAIEAVAATGEDPTNELVRDQLGGRGSFSTISPVVRAWKTERASQPPVQPANNNDDKTKTEVPAVIEQALTQITGLLKHLEKSVPSQIDAAVNIERRRARGELDAERETLGKQIQSLCAEIATHVHNIKTLEEEGQRFEDELEVQKAASADKETAHKEALEDQRAKSAEHLAEVRAGYQREIDRMNKQINELNTTLGTKENAHKIELEDKQARFNEQLARTRADLQGTIDRLSKQIDQMKNDHAALLDEQRKHNDTLEKSLVDQRAQFDRTLDNIRLDHQSNARQAEQMLADLRERLDSSEKTRRQLEHTIVELTRGRKHEE